jgi:hypothetical protein
MKSTGKLSILSALLVLLSGACAEVWDIAWGTGNAIGRMSVTWAGLAFLFSVMCLAGFLSFVRVFWSDDLSTKFAQKLEHFRRKLGWGRWLAAAVVFVFPAAVLQFTVFGIIFQGIFLRLVLWGVALFALAFLLARGESLFVQWNAFLFLLVVSASLFAALASLTFVTDYPFSLGWSEGNRLWDYSILFGSGRYQVPAGQEISVFLDSGRQFIGGIPFLLPGLTIGQERLWLGLVSIVPYLLLGLVSFRFFTGQRIFWLSAILWAWLFLRQGPINATLILCAVLVVLAWRSNLWVSAAFVLLATYAAYLSRYTWIFAPVIWFLTLELFDGFKDFGKTPLFQRTRLLLAALALCGITGLFILGGAAGAYLQLDWAYRLPPIFSKLTSAFGRVSDQPLLWYRLLPNETYGNGILVGLLAAILPLGLVLSYQIMRGEWKVNAWQKWILSIPLFAFLAVGLIISVKIGGGDLHNMDMFLVGFFLAAVLSLTDNADWLEKPHPRPLWARAALVLLILIPGVPPLQALGSYHFGRQASWLVVLTDAPNERALDMYPTDEVIEKSLALIQAEADSAKMSGEVLFIDQRQLLTFGSIRNVPLVSQYEKKVLIEQALASNTLYFQAFYRDLSEKRFSLVVIQPLTTFEKYGDNPFGEENNAWVKWVANPLLCFYEVKQTLSDVNVQLLIPRQGMSNCAKAMP